MTVLHNRRIARDGQQWRLLACNPGGAAAAISQNPEQRP